MSKIVNTDQSKVSTFLCPLSDNALLNNLFPRVPRPPCPSLLFHLLENLAQEVFKAERNVPVSVVVVLFEHVRHALQRDASLHKQVKAHDALVALVVGAEDELDKLRGEAVAERNQGVGELGEGNVAGAIDVEAVKERAPGGEERPQAAELVKADAAAAVGVKHANHHAHRLDVKGGPVAVDESGRELLFGQLAGPCAEHVSIGACRFGIRVTHRLCLRRERGAAASGLRQNLRRAPERAGVSRSVTVCCRRPVAAAGSKWCARAASGHSWWVGAGSGPGGASATVARTGPGAASATVARTGLAAASTGPLAAAGAGSGCSAAAEAAAGDSFAAAVAVDGAAEEVEAAAGIAAEKEVGAVEEQAPGWGYSAGH